MNSTLKPLALRADLASEDVEMAVKRTRQLAALVPLLRSNRDSALIELASELSADLSCALTNLH